MIEVKYCWNIRKKKMMLLWKTSVFWRHACCLFARSCFEHSFITRWRICKRIQKFDKKYNNLLYLQAFIPVKWKLSIISLIILILEIAPRFFINAVQILEQRWYEFIFVIHFKKVVNWLCKWKARVLLYLEIWKG